MVAVGLYHMAGKLLLSYNILQQARSGGIEPVQLVILVYVQERSGPQDSLPLPSLFCCRRR